MPQDMPPVGGYGPVLYKRNLPARGFRPAMYLVGTAALMTYGFWRVGQGIREHKCVASILWTLCGVLSRKRDWSVRA
jgi:NADH dehydrogenase (ubiquinone) 1 alpha subcomplex subunit 13